MKRILAIVLAAATSLSVLSCVSRNRYKKTSGPGNPRLTYDLVNKNVNAFKGKRVRWFGRQISFESRGAPGRKEYVNRFTYVDVESWQAGEVTKAFVVEYNSKSGLTMLPGEGWVTGTIEGTHTIGITRRWPSGEETYIPQVVPLLSHPKVEKSTSRHD